MNGPHEPCDMEFKNSFEIKENKVVPERISYIKIKLCNWLKSLFDSEPDFYAYFMHIDHVIWTSKNSFEIKENKVVPERISYLEMKLCYWLKSSWYALQKIVEIKEKNFVSQNKVTTVVHLARNHLVKKRPLSAKLFRAKFNHPTVQLAQNSVL